ncbi:pyridine nucleotide-disulfide oxidoreductase domain-containing protein 1-like isoform X2 [Ylistrum balloti]|uniref:pyridine nucleotide-disulfide oxidoreductase domain-containing protein 1-like isoform X2 n=1 Tax=Ylistrum balloti TaxID=509963 RepID=UPI002905B232|nr:pyridine nucleotide-disulfide oxidoreductase domain-containing protein 1-like isoform X2 [Ylistrum balloti]
MAEKMEDPLAFIIVGGGIAGVSCAEMMLTVQEGQTFRYKQLCICSGGRPKVIAKDNPYVLGIRDTQSVKEFQKHLHNARRIMVIGNGGIATELVYEVEGCEVIWAIKDKSISSAFVDAGAAEFFLPQLNSDKDEGNKPSKRLKYTTEDNTLKVEPKEETFGGALGPDWSTKEETFGGALGPDWSTKEETFGGALGPDWSTNLKMTGQQEISHQVHVEYRVEVKVIHTAEDFVAKEMTEATLPGFTHDRWPVYVELTNGQVYGCDFVVSATGVVPNTSPFITGNQFALSADGGMLVNEKMETSVADIYAAGDVCSANWTPSPHWIQMRLWTQARQMGAYSAQCMVAKAKDELISLDFCFEMFAHVTKFFGLKVILLGKFNAQGLEGDHELLLRMTKGKEYIKAVLKDGTMHGAILIGETDLEETFENLILNQIDLTPFKDDLLDPNIDLEDFFD